MSDVLAQRVGELTRIIEDWKNKSKQINQLADNVGYEDGMLVAVFSPSLNKAVKYPLPNYNLDEYQLKSEKNIAEGYLGLDENTLINEAYIPNLPISRIVNLQSNLDRDISSISITGDTNKILTLTRFDGTTITESFTDVDTDTNVFLNGLNFNTSNGTFTAVLNDTNTSSVSLDGRYSLLGHTHNISSISNLQSILDGKENVFTKNSAFNKNFGTSAGTVAQGNHTHTNLIALDNRDVKPIDVIGAGNNGVKQIRTYFTSLSGLNGVSNTNYQDLLVLDTYSDISGGRINALAFDKNGGKAIRHYSASASDTLWGAGDLLLTDANFIAGTDYQVPITKAIIDALNINATTLDNLDSSDFTKKESGVLSNGSLRNYIRLNDYDDDTNSTGIISYVRDGVWYLNKAIGETNDIRLRLNNTTYVATEQWVLDNFSQLSGDNLAFTNISNVFGSHQTISSTHATKLNLIRTDNNANISIKFGGSSIDRYLGYNNGELYSHSTNSLASGNLIYHSGNFTAGVNYQTPLSNVAFTNVNNNFSVAQSINGDIKQSGSFVIKNETHDLYLDASASGKIIRFRTQGIQRASLNSSGTFTATNFNGNWNGKTASVSNSNDTIVLRNSAGYIYGNYYFSEGIKSNIGSGSIGGFAVRNTNNDGFIYGAALAQVKTALGIDTINANSLNNINSGQFLRSDVDDIALGKIVFGNTTTNRQAGIYGFYNSSKVGHIWSMGTAYKIEADGTGFGNIYGAAYQYSSSLRARGHQLVWCQNGSPSVALGTDVWTSGKVIANNVVASSVVYANGGNSAEWNSAYSWGNHSSQGYLTTETDPIFTAWNKSDGISITESQISDFGNYALSTHSHSWAQITGKPTTFTPSTHSHSNIIALDDRDIKPNVVDKSSKQIRAYFTSLGGLTGSANTDYQDLLVLDTYSDSSGGKINALAFDKSLQRIKHYLAGWNDTTWGTAKTLAYIEDTYQYFNLKTNGIQRKTIQSGNDLNFESVDGFLSIGYAANGTVQFSYDELSYNDLIDKPNIPSAILTASDNYRITSTVQFDNSVQFSGGLNSLSSITGTNITLSGGITTEFSTFNDVATFNDDIQVASSHSLYIGTHRVVKSPQVNSGNNVETIWQGTEAQYNAISSKDSNTLYFIT